MSVRIGLIWPQTSDLWTAGGIYFSNLLESLELAGRLDDITIIEPEGGCYSQLKSRPVDSVVTYRPRRVESLPVRILDYASRYFGIRDPVASAIRRSGVSVVFGYPEGRRRMPVPWVGWVTDFQHIHYPQFFPAQQAEGLNRAFGYVAENAALAILSSQDSYKDFVTFSPANARKGRVVPFVSLFPEEVLQQDPATVVSRYRIGRPFVIVSNQWWRHKNHEVAIRAAAIQRDRGEVCTWVMTGVLADYRDPGYVSRMLQLIAEEGLEDRIKILGILPRADQIQLMRAADCVVQPSLFEGWSTLVEDAKTLGQRIVVSDIAIHREQEPPSSLFFDPASPEELADQVRAMLAGACDRTDEAEARAQSRVRAREWGERFHAICMDAAGKR